MRKEATVPLRLDVNGTWHSALFVPKKYIYYSSIGKV